MAYHFKHFLVSTKCLIVCIWHITNICRPPKMGAKACKSAESETCRIIVEDVTSSMTSQEVSLPEVFSPVSEERRRSSASSDTTTVCGGSRRGSTLSMDTRRSSGGGTTEFWVPPSVIQRTRSRSLVPPDQISCDDNDNNTRGTPCTCSFIIIVITRKASYRSQTRATLAKRC